ncbi:hypothetical protein C458_02950 [Haloferax sp. ATCC BAA-644]|nr:MULTISPECIES: hypothetical protein [unclassified Haloferax]ELZ61845.1 hypothetical protein C460_01515 [Haloferax sp. ATCC BAA-646]ELZ61958.1 hypothetical protein C459_14326 [Haloferax sp. ATCC BAA-645]ELZ70876.1 hypothetical protein C458_02950 [Haloferax sp. ATCC BAA-644]
MGKTHQSTHRRRAYVRSDAGRSRTPHAPQKVRERYGEHYRIVQLHDGIKLIPIEDDPLDALRTEFADVEKTAGELRHGARNAAIDEAGR